MDANELEKRCQSAYDRLEAIIAETARDDPSFEEYSVEWHRANVELLKIHLQPAIALAKQGYTEYQGTVQRYMQNAIRPSWQFRLFYWKGVPIADRLVLVEEYLRVMGLPTPPPSASRESSPEVPLPQVGKRARSQDSAIAIESVRKRKPAIEPLTNEEPQVFPDIDEVDKILRKHTRVDKPTVNHDVQISAEDLGFTHVLSTDRTSKSAIDDGNEIFQEDDRLAWTPPPKCAQVAKRKQDDTIKAQALDPIDKRDVRRATPDEDGLYHAEDDDESYHGDSEDASFRPIAPKSLNVFGTPSAPKRRGRPPNHAAKGGTKPKKGTRNARNTSSTHTVIKNLKAKKRSAREEIPHVPRGSEDAIRYSGRGRPAEMPSLPCPQGINPRVWAAASFRSQQQRMEGLMALAEMSSEASDWSSTSGEEDNDQDDDAEVYGALL